MNRTATCIITLALLTGASETQAVTFGDGGVHTINDATYSTEVVRVQAGPGASTTTVNVLNGALIGVDSFGHSIFALDSSFVDISGGTLSGQARAIGQAEITISGGSVGGGVRADEGAEISISNGSFGDQAGESVRADGFGGTTTMIEVLDGTFTGSVRAGENSQITIHDGSFGSDGSHSVRAFGGFSETTFIEVFDGTFSGGVRADGDARIVIHSGSFGNDPFFGQSVLAIGDFGDSGPLAIIDIWGGTYTSSFDAFPNSIINVYGFNLEITNFVLTGTLADGSPINVVANESPDGGGLGGPGLIILHNIPEPSTFVLTAFGLLGMGWCRRKQA